MELPEPQWAFPLREQTLHKVPPIAHSPVTPSSTSLVHSSPTPPAPSMPHHMLPILPDEISAVPSFHHSPAASTSSRTQPRIAQGGDAIVSSFLPVHALAFPEPLDELVLPDNMNMNINMDYPLDAAVPPTLLEQSADLVGSFVAPADFLLPDPVPAAPCDASLPPPTTTVTIAPTVFAATPAPDSASGALLPKHTSSSVLTASKLMCRNLERHAKDLACDKYEADHSRDPAPRSSVERRKRVRNKSAYVSRHSRRRYSELLVGYYTRATEECDVIRNSIGGLNDEISQLRKQLSVLAPTI